MTHRLAILLSLILLTGCASTLTGARVALDTVDKSYAALEPKLERQRRDDGDACFAASPPGDPAVAPCLDAVRTRWRPVEAAVSVLYAAIIAAQGAMGTVEAGAAIGRAPDVAKVVVVVGKAVDATEELQRAVEAVRAAETKR